MKHGLVDELVMRREGAGDGGAGEGGGGGGEGSLSSTSTEITSSIADGEDEASLLEEGEGEEESGSGNEGRSTSTSTSSFTSPHPPFSSTLGLDISMDRDERNKSLLARLSSAKPFDSLLPSTTTSSALRLKFPLPARPVPLPKRLSQQPILSTSLLLAPVPLHAPDPQRLGSSCSLLEVEMETELEDGEILEGAQEEKVEKGEEGSRVGRAEQEKERSKGWEDVEVSETVERSYRRRSVSTSSPRPILFILPDGAPWSAEEDDLLQRHVNTYIRTPRDRRPRYSRSRGSFIELVHPDFPIRSLTSLTNRFVTFHSLAHRLSSLSSSSSSAVRAESWKREINEVEERELEEVELFLKGKGMRSDGSGEAGRGRGREERRGGGSGRSGWEGERDMKKGGGRGRKEWEERRERRREEESSDPSRPSHRSSSRRGRSRSPSSTSTRYSGSASDEYFSQFTNVRGDLVNLTNLFIGNIPWDADEEDLRIQFSRFGRIRNSSRIRRHPYNDNRGSCFIAFEDERDAREARARMDGRHNRGRPLRVDYHRPLPSRRDDYFRDQHHEEDERRPRPRRVDSSPPPLPAPASFPLSPPYSNASLDLSSVEPSPSEECGPCSWMRETESRLLGGLVEHLESMELEARLQLMERLEKSTPEVRKNFLSLLSIRKGRGDE